MTQTQARTAGYHPLTKTYRLPQEQAWLDHVLADLRRGAIHHVLVWTRRGAAVWRGGNNQPGRKETHE